ncbi:MAG: bifunctional GNAT family N-acetyltransferase/carbon-nitrogen hydrolase family protein [Anaerolineae bacterium]
MRKPNKKSIKVRRWTAADIAAVVACHKAAYPDYPEDGGHYNARSYQLQFDAFPQGQFLAELDGRVIGYATSIIVQLDDDTQYTYPEITGAGSFSSHTPAGDTLYGADIAVHPDFRGLGVSKLLYKKRKQLMKQYNLRRAIAHGRIPGYSDFVGQLTAHEYVTAVKQGRLQDPALNAHLNAGYDVKGVLLDIVADESSLNHCTFLEMPNPDYKPQKRNIAAAPLRKPVRKIRVCAAQYQMRAIRSWDEFEQTVEFFVNTADTYHSHFLLLPEFFSAQLFTMMPSSWDSLTAVHELANMSDRYIEMFKKMASTHNLYIIGGSHPVRRDDKLYNVAHLFTPTGNVYSQDKLHITPSERAVWDIRPGRGIKIFETPLARIAIQVCYDIEFPEIPRLLTLAGAEVIFVPFSTDERKAYLRVRYSAQARAVENSIYTVIAGNVGNLPTRTYLLNYGQAAVFTPSDFEFPVNAIAGEAEPNLETVVISDLDLTSLVLHRDQGSTRPLYDRRTDLYDLRARIPIELVRTE